MDVACTEWRVHIGAHKTATTHLQLTLESAIPKINALGGSFVPMPVVRELFATPPQNRWRRRAARHLPMIRPLLLRNKAEQIRLGLMRHANVSGPIAFSDEDILGRTLCILDGKLYPDLTKVHLVSQLARVAPLHIFITIRSLDGYLPSAYAEALKGFPLTRADFQKAVQKFSADSLHWTSLIERIQSEAPMARLEVWNFDDYTANWRHLHQSLLGIPLANFPNISPPTRTRTPSEAAILAAEADKTAPSSTRSAMIREVYRRDIEDTKNKKFNPLSSYQKAHFQKLYNEDLAAIQRNFPGVLKII